MGCGLHSTVYTLRSVLGEDWGRDTLGALSLTTKRLQKNCPCPMMASAYFGSCGNSDRDESSMCGLAALGAPLMVSVIPHSGVLAPSGLEGAADVWPE